MVPLSFPYAAPPGFGETLEIAPRLHWLRLPLPFRLNHVNVYLAEGEAGWTILDTGTDTPDVRAAWQGVLGGLLARQRVEAIVVTHYHPDHVGAAAWLSAETGAPLLMGEVEYLTARLHLATTAEDAKAEQAFYRLHGLGPEACAGMGERFHRYRSVVPDLPRIYRPLRSGDRILLGTLEATVLCRPGHSPAQALLHVPSHDLLFAADHVLPQISPNVSVAEERPDDDPLGLYLASLAALPAEVPDRTLVLPGHRLPFFGLHRRCAELAAHHAARCADLAEICDPRRSPTLAEIVPRLFTMELDAHQFWFAFSETLAHCNLMGRRGELERIDDGPVRRWRRSERVNERGCGPSPTPPR